MSLERFFTPRHVAVIGASAKPTRPGHVILRNFLEGSFSGKVYPVNPKHDTMFGKKCYPSILDIKGLVDLAVVVVPGKFVPQVLEECGKKKVSAAIVISSGFKEIGNTKLEKKVREIARKNKLRVVGTNCIGIFDPYSGVDTIFNPRYKLERPGKGSISFISQSGATGTVMLDWMAMKGYKISKFVSYGNATDVDESDLLQYMAKDKNTSVVCAYFEGLNRGRTFFELARKLSKTKPIIAQKGGTTEAGHRAVASHTGSLAGSAAVYSAAFRQAGITQARDLEEIFDFARILSTQPLPKGRKVQIITNGGGFGVLMTDAVISHGLEMAVMSKPGKDALKKAFPPYFTVSNPIDLTGDATTGYYSMAIDRAMKDPKIDIVAVILLFQVPNLTPDVTETIIEASRRGKKPVVVVASGGRYTEVLKKSLEDSGVPCFSYPERASRAIEVLCDHAEYRRKK